MSILVTGASGFVGGALARRLAEAGEQVHVFVRRDSLRQRLAGVAGIVEHLVDLRNADQVQQAVRTVCPRVVYHCGVYGGFSFQDNSEAIFATNLIGTMNLVRACAEVGFERFVSTGSSSEYGFKPVAMREEDRPEPLGDYAVAKCAATLFCSSEARLRGLPIVTLRVFSPYGPWDDPRRFIPMACRTLLAGESMHLATPRAVRDYLYIDDLLDLYRRVVELPVEPGEIFNAGSGRQVSVAEVAEQLRQLTGGPALLIGAELPRRPEPSSWVADVSKARSLLGWTPRVSLEEGLSRTVAWMREHPEFMTRQL
jgi:nucleoside-diphosphate-sugar epimerase